MSKKQAAFSIDGTYISDLSRQLLIENQWKKALKILDGLDGITTDEKISILSGEQYLVGVNHCKLVKDNREEANEYKQYLKQYFSQIISYQDCFFIPYAYVNSWCSEDIFNPETYHSKTSFDFTSEHDHLIKFNFQHKDKTKHFHFRSLHYADDPYSDLALTVNTSNEQLKKLFNSVVLFKKTHDVPFFLEYLISKTPEESIVNSIKKLDWRGANVYYSHLSSENNFLSDEHEQDSYSFKADSPNIEQYRQQIIDFANNDKEYGWKELSNSDGKILKVPYRVFIHYSLHHALSSEKDFQLRNKKKNEIPPYVPFSISGLKSPCDNPLHTDLCLGAGLELAEVYRHDCWQTKLIDDAVSQYDQDFFNFDFHIITRDGLTQKNGTTCTIHNFNDIPQGERILILPHLGIEFEDAAMQCDAIICEQGGPLSHLVIVNKELHAKNNKTCPIIRVDDACIKFLITKHLNIDLINGHINETSTLQKKIKK